MKANVMIGDKSVLIETYWNVNNKKADRGIQKKGVLIETYWNVNLLAALCICVSLSLNRNILECKWC